MTSIRTQLVRRSLILLICSVTATGAATRITAPGAPKAVVPFNSFNFGDVYKGEVISQIFVIRNEGDADLQIKDFEAGCGCSVTRSDKLIPPGKEGTATLEVQTVSQSGEISKPATLHTNDPARPAIVFTLMANVLGGAPLRQGKYIGPIFLSPDTVSGLHSMQGKKATAEFSVTAEDAPVKVLRVEGAKHFATRVQVVEVGRSYKIVVESLPTDISGLYTDQLRVFTDSPSLPAFPVELALRVYPRQ